MNLGDRDLFELWRLLLGVTCGIYATVVMLRAVVDWVRYLSGAQQTTRLMRSYAIVHLMRLRFRRFSNDLLAIGAYLLLLAGLLYSHHGG